MIDNHKPLKVSTVGQMVPLKDMQQELYNAISKCVSTGTQLDWDVLVDVWTKFKPVHVHHYTRIDHETKERSYYADEYIIKDAYKYKSSMWTYTIRPRIFQWFKSTIGVLVIKNKLIVIPNINLE